MPQLPSADNMRLVIVVILLLIMVTTTSGSDGNSTSSAVAIQTPADSKALTDQTTLISRLSLPSTTINMTLSGRYAPEVVQLSPVTLAENGEVFIRGGRAGEVCVLLDCAPLYERPVRRVTAWEYWRFRGWIRRGWSFGVRSPFSRSY